MHRHNQIPYSSGTSVPVNLFFVFTALQNLVSECIVEELESDARNYLFVMRGNREPPPVRQEYWDYTGEILRPWEHPLPGILGGWKRIVENLHYVRHQLPENITHLRMHIVSINRAPYNFFINYLRKCFPDADFRVRLLPDGTYNLARHPLRFANYIDQFLRKFRYFYHNDLQYYCFSGDTTGVDAKIVDRIYWLSGLSCEYPKEKTYLLRLEAKEKKIKHHYNQALVLGDPVANDICQDLILRVLQETGIQEVLYKPHPDETLTLSLPKNCRVLQTNESLEEHLMQHSYALIAGISSTGLLTARVLCSDKVRIISYGTDRLQEMRKSRHKKLMDPILQAYKNSGIELVNAKK